MRVLHEVTKLNDLGIRLRFLTARQVELAVAGMFPDAIAYPFGSSINGYGRMGCDLDLILRLSKSNQVCCHDVVKTHVSFCNMYILCMFRKVQTIVVD